jgi:hypothetical protein
MMFVSNQRGSCRQRQRAVSLHERKVTSYPQPIQ